MMFSIFKKEIKSLRHWTKPEIICRLKFLIILDNLISLGVFLVSFLFF